MTLHKLLSPEEAAPLIGVEVATLANWRHRGTGPKFIKTPGKGRGRVNYDPADIADWRDANRVSSTSEER
jgi:predicted site-specific integrase-resolvase